MSCIIDNNELDITPSRKRKRESERFDTSVDVTPVGFTNAAFSSTPKKAIGKRLTRKEIQNPFLTNHCLEVKSIAEIVRKHNISTEAKTERISAPDNPYEVLRNPPKKKKKRSEYVACFENPALNLELPEKQFNPFEVRRPNAPSVAADAEKGFVNEALSLRGQDVPAARNPFEIPRCSAVSLKAANPTGVENLALEPLQPSKFEIALPFAPTLGCRIDFKNISLSQLTPSKLLAEKLVFSPVCAKTPKRSLGSINEETMDIGKELDRYQLELENSINEAKLRRNNCIRSEEIVLEVEQKITFSQKLTEIVEEDEKVVEKDVKKFSNESSSREQNKIKSLHPQKKEEIIANNAVNVEMCSLLSTDNVEIDHCNQDVIYSSDDDEDKLNFKTPFVRAYRRAEPPAPKTPLTISKESLNSIKSDKSNETEPKKSNNVKIIIRNSIRKFIHTHAPSNQTENVDKKESPVLHQEKLASVPTTIMSSIRNSLRRKPSKQQPLIEDENAQRTSAAEISIIDSSERTMKLKSNFLQTEYAKIDDFTNEKKHSLRSSIRKSTREVRNQLLKTVFHKNQDEYAFK